MLHQPNRRLHNPGGARVSGKPGRLIEPRAPTRRYKTLPAAPFLARPRSTDDEVQDLQEFPGAGQYARLTSLPSLWTWRSSKPDKIIKNPALYDRTTNSQHSGVPRLMPCAACLPNTSVRCRGCKPFPGRIDRTFAAVNISPSFTSSTTNKERRNARLVSSLPLKPKCTSPRASSAVRTASTIVLNSSGSRENALSGPGTERDRVKCFSIRHAPKATAATGAVIPIVWSDNPTGTPNSRAISGIVRKFISDGDAG